MVMGTTRWTVYAVGQPGTWELDRDVDIAICRSWQQDHKRILVMNVDSRMTKS